MRLKKPKKNKTSTFQFRCTEEDKNKIMRKALLYTEGNISEYIVFAATEFVPDKHDFEDNKKGRK